MASWQTLADYIESGKPIIGLRTATHAFNNPKNKDFAKYHWNNEGGFGRKVLGETWVNPHGAHGTQSTRGILAKGADKHPILKGIKDGEIWGPTVAEDEPRALGEVRAFDIREQRTCGGAITFRQPLPMSNRRVFSRCHGDERRLIIVHELADAAAHEANVAA